MSAEPAASEAQSRPLPADFCPYKGLLPYTADDRDFFYGRERETELIVANLYAAPLTVLYGASGVGKSSVLLAGVTPRLEQTPRVAVVVFRDWHALDFAEALKRAVSASIARAAGRAISVDESLPFDEFLAVCLRQLRGDAFFVFDQFEEYFLYHPLGEAQPFDAELARAINRKDLDANFLISLREDGLSLLDRFQGRIPNLLGNLLRLEHLDPAAAAHAIRAPIERYNQRLPPERAPVSIEDALVDEVVEQLQRSAGMFGEGGLGGVALREAGERPVETPFLQLVMTRLWNEERRRRSPVLRRSTLEQLGGTARIVQTHLDGAMERLRPRDRATAARLFRYLVTPTGTKIAYTPANVAYYAKVSAERAAAVMERLCKPDVRILRPTAGPPDRPDSVRYEIAHDVLALAVLGWSRRFASDRFIARARLVMACLAAVAVGGSVGLHLSFQRQIAAQKDRYVAAQQEAESANQALSNEKVAAKLEVETERGLVEKQAAARQLASRSQALPATGSADDQQLRTLLAAESMKRYPTRDACEVLAPELEVPPSRLPQDRVRQNVKRVRGRVYSIAFSPDGRWLASGGADRTARLLEVGGPREVVLGQREPVRAVAFSRSRGYLLTADAGRSLHLYSVPDGETVRTLDDGGTTFAVAIRPPDGKQIATCSAGVPGVRLWNEATGGFETLDVRLPDLRALAFSHDGRWLAVGSGAGKALLWDLASAEAAGAWSHERAVRDLAFSPDGAWVATVSDDATARVWDVVGRKEAARLTHEDRVREVGFSPDGKYLATGSLDGTARVWEVGSWRLVGRLIHGSAVTALAFSPTSRFLATSSWDGFAHVWAVPSSDEVARIAHDAAVNDVAFSPDGKLIATGGNDKTVRIETWRATELVEAACARLKRNFTREEWRRYFGSEEYRLTCPSLPPPPPTAEHPPKAPRRPALVDDY